VYNNQWKKFNKTVNKQLHRRDGMNSSISSSACDNSVGFTERLRVIIVIIINAVLSIVGNYTL